MGKIGHGEIESQTYTVGGQTIASWAVTQRDQSGRITQKTETVTDELGQTVTDNYIYDYDAFGRLLRVTKNGTPVEEYAYDEEPHGTRTYEMNLQRGINGRTYTYDIEDRLDSMDDGTSFTFDTDGFLMSKTTAEGTTLYDYSSRGELLSVTLSDGRLVEYVHDPIGRRIAKIVNGTIVEKYLWNGRTQLLAVYNGDDSLKMRFEYADGRIPVSMTTDGQKYYLACDQVGSLRIVANSSGTVVKRIEYDTFGNILTDSDPLFEIPFGFAGGLHDRDTGLVRFGFRDYDSDTGRWAAKDPIGFAGGDTDLFGYCFYDTVNMIDPIGLIGIGPQWSSGFVIGLMRVDIDIEIRVFLDLATGKTDHMVALTPSTSWGDALGLYGSLMSFELNFTNANNRNEVLGENINCGINIGLGKGKAGGGEVALMYDNEGKINWPSDHLLPVFEITAAHPWMSTALGGFGGIDAGAEFHLSHGDTVNMAKILSGKP